MKKILLIIMFCLISLPCLAGYNVCYDAEGKNLKVTGSSPIKDCLYFSDQNMDEYNRVKTLYQSVGFKNMKVVDGVVEELSQEEKDAILLSEETAQKEAEISTVDNMNISIKDAFKAWLTVFNSKVPEQYQITGAELIEQVKKDKGIIE